ncbi:MAG: permease prefix domain 1-containing protein, partial [Eubacterium sp.]|nr:permease prefix domain 1-containing protein [Eubacterium sp.]
MKNYVSTVLGKINNKTQRNQIEAELQSHIEDRIDYYVNAGYDLETATEKANAHMGDTAELVGEQLKSLSINPKIIRFVNIAFALTNLLVLFVFFNTLLLCFLYLDWEYSSIITNPMMYSVSSIYLIVCFAELFVGLKLKQSFLTKSTKIMFSIHTAFMLGYMPFVFCIYEIIVGNGKDYQNLLLVHQWECVGIVAYALCI